LGSIFSPKTPAAPPPPAPVEYVNTRDETAGTQSNYVTNPDGTKTLVTSRLPLTPEQQAYEDKIQAIASDNLNYIQKLSTNFDVNDPALSWLKQYTDDYQKTQTAALDKATEDGADQSENVLARYGQADSTAGVQDRQGRAANYQAGRQQITDNISGIIQNARQNELSNATNLYGLATGRQDAILGNLANSLGRTQQFQLSDGGNQVSRNGLIYQGGLQQQSLQQQASQQGFNNLASLAALGTLAAGPSGFALYGAAKKGAT